MSEKKLKYSVLQYSPSLISGESINLGVLATSEVEPLADFISTKKMKRIKEFDDEIDEEMVKLVLQGIKDEVEVTLENCNKIFDIQEFIQYYCNEYHFTRAIELSYQDFDKMVDELKRMYLPQDLAKDQRASHKEELQFMAKILETNHVDFKRNVKEWGNYNDQITYDFRIKNYGIKLFWLKGKDLRRLTNDVKAWAWNCQYSPADIQTVIIYNNDADTNKKQEMKTFLEIFKASSDKIYSWTDGMKWLETLAKSDSDDKNS